VNKRFEEPSEAVTKLEFPPANKNLPFPCVAVMKLYDPKFDVLEVQVIPSVEVEIDPVDPLPLPITNKLLPNAKP